MTSIKQRQKTRIDPYVLNPIEMRLEALIQQHFPERIKKPLEKGTSISKELMFDSIDWLTLDLEIENAFGIEFSPDRQLDTLEEVAEGIFQSKQQFIDKQILNSEIPKGES